jgi:hypothetical protein
LILLFISRLLSVVVFASESRLCDGAYESLMSSWPTRVRLDLVLDPATVRCQECGVDLAANSPDLRLEVTCDDKLVTLLHGVLGAGVRRETGITRWTLEP